MDKMASENKSSSRGRPLKSTTITKIAVEDSKQTILTSKKKEPEANKGNDTEGSVTSLLNRMMDKMDSMSEEIQTVREEMKETRKEYTEVMNLIKEVATIKEEMERKELRWAVERKSLEERIKSLETIEEGRRSKEKRCNVIIKGLNIQAKTEEVEKFMREKLHVEAKIEYAQEIRTASNNKMIRVKLVDWENKKLKKI